MKVSIKLGDLELRGNDDGGEAITLEIMNDDDMALARWYPDGESYHLRFIGRRPFYCVGNVPPLMKAFWILAEVGQHLIEGLKP